MQWTNLETKICDLHGLISLLVTVLVHRWQSTEISCNKPSYLRACFSSMFLTTKKKEPAYSKVITYLLFQLFVYTDHSFLY